MLISNVKLQYLGWLMIKNNLQNIVLETEKRKKNNRNENVGITICLNG